jgi:flavin-dependent dehydrogenase
VSPARTSCPNFTLSLALHCNPYGCGWHVDRARSDAILASAGADVGAELIFSARATSCRSREDHQWLLEAAQRAATLTFGGWMLVDGSGPKALIARGQGSQAHVVDRLIGAATFSHCSETSQCTFIEAVEEG